MIVTETIHHGDYFNVRTVEVEPTWEGFIELLNGSPYNKFRSGDGENKYVRKLFDDLLANGSGELGWARYKVADESSSLREQLTEATGHQWGEGWVEFNDYNREGLWNNIKSPDDYWAPETIEQLRQVYARNFGIPPVHRHVGCLFVGKS